MLDYRTEVALIIDEISDKRFVGATEEEAGKVFASWLNSNKDWITAGTENKVTEIVEVSFDLVSFSGQIIVAWLGNTEELQEEVIRGCRFESREVIAESSR